MTVPQTEPVVNHYGNNSATKFDFGFYIENENQITVQHTNLDGITTTLQYGVDYSINEIGNENGSYIVFPLEGSSYSVLAWDLSSDKKELLSIALDLPFAQEFEFDISGDLDKSQVEKALDYSIRIDQVLKRKIERALLIPEGSNVNTSELSNDLIIAADNISDINTIAAEILNIKKVSEDISDVNIVADSISNVNSVSENINTIIDVDENEINIKAVNNNKDNIDTVAVNIDDINNIADSIDAVNKVSANTDDINICSENIASIKNATIHAQAAAQSAGQAAASEANALSSKNSAYESSNSAFQYANNAEIWAEGNSEQVQALGGTRSSKDWAEYAASQATGANQNLSNLSSVGLDKINQSKALETGSVSSDADVYADVLKYKNSGTDTGIDTIKPDDYEVVGEPTITEDGIVSGINNSNAITYNINMSDFLNNSWEIIGTKLAFNNNSTPISFAPKSNLEYGCVRANLSLKTIRFNGYTGTEKLINGVNIQKTFQENPEYYIPKVTYNNKNGEYRFYIDTGNGFELIGSQIPNSDNKQLTAILNNIIPKLQLNNYYDVSSTKFDINTYKVYINGDLVYQPCLKIPYTLSKTGSKIVDAAYRDRVQDVYEQYGTAMYYTLDEENQNFTLPMGEIYGIIEKKNEELNNPYTLFDSKYSETPLYNASWLLSNGTYYAKSVYVTAYEALVVENNSEIEAGTSVSLPSGGNYVKRGLPIFDIAAELTQQNAASEGWSNVNNAFDDGSDTYASCGTATDYIEVTYSKPVIVSGFSATGSYISSEARACNLAIYTVNDNGDESLLANGTGASNSATYTTGAEFTAVRTSKLRFKLINGSSGAPTEEFPTRINSINIDLSDADPDDYDFVINRTDETFRLPLLNGSEINIDYSQGVPITSGYIAPCNGVVSGGNNSVTDNNALLYVNDILVSYAWGGSVVQDGTNLYVKVSKGDKITFTNLNLKSSPIRQPVRFFPAVGNGSLYYYVGETVQNANLINAGRFSEILANKADADLSNCTRPYVTETYVNGKSGYTVWSNGYCEQWGNPDSGGANQTITLLKAYKNLDYNILATSQSQNNNSAQVGGIVISNSSFNLYNGASTTSYWQTKGYITEG